jgi:hypothetical protein
MEDWLLLQRFYNGLIQKSHEQLVATAGGSFMSLALGKDKILLEKIAKNQSYQTTINAVRRLKKFQKKFVH